MTPVASLPAAGRELDREIAFRVFGHGVTHPPQSSPGYWIEWNGEPERLGSSAKPLPEYSTDIAAAWEVIEKLDGGGRYKSWWWRLDTKWRENFYIAQIFEGSVPIATADAETMAHAICLSALEAVAALKAVAP